MSAFLQDVRFDAESWADLCGDEAVPLTRDISPSDSTGPGVARPVKGVLEEIAGRATAALGRLTHERPVVSVRSDPSTGDGYLTFRVPATSLTMSQLVGLVAEIESASPPAVGGCGGASVSSSGISVRGAGVAITQNSSGFEMDVWDAESWGCSVSA